MLIHEILQFQNPNLLRQLCEMFGVKTLRKTPGSSEDYYDYAWEMQTDSEGQRLNYGW